MLSKWCNALATFFAVLIGFASYGQSARVDEIYDLKFRLGNSSVPSEVVRLSSEIGGRYLNYNLDSSFHYLKIAEAHLTGVSDPALRAEVMLKLGDCLSLKGAMTALDYYHKAMKLFRLSGDRRAELKVIAMICDNEIGSEASDYYLKLLQAGLELARTEGQKHSEAYLLFIKARLLKDQKQYGKAHKHFEQSLDLHNQIDFENPSALISEWGNLYFEQGRYQSALKTYQKALPYLHRADDQLGFGYILTNIGMTQARIGLVNTAVETFRNALQARENAGDKIGSIYTQLQLALHYIDLGDYASAKDALATAVKQREGFDSTLFTEEFRHVEGMLLLHRSANDQLLLHLAEDLENTHPVKAFEINKELADYWIRQSDQEKAVKNLTRAERLIQNLNHPIYTAKICLLRTRLADQENLVIEELRACLDHIITGESPLDEGEIYAALALYSRKSMSPTEAYHYLDQLKRLVDQGPPSGINFSLQQLYSTTLIAFREMDIKMHKKRERQMALLMGVVGVLTVIVLIVIVRYLRLNRQNLKLAQEQVRLKEISEQLILSRFQEYQNKMEEEQMGLIDSLRSKNKFMAELKTMIGENANENASQLRQDLDQLLKSIQNQLEHGNTASLKTEEEQFIQQLTEAYPNLTKKEVRLCLYIKMGYSNSEIAALNHVQLSAVEKSKYRVRNKLGLASAAELKDLVNSL